MNNKGITIFFDGICVLCTRLVKFLIFIDFKKRIVFSTLNSTYAKKHIGKTSIDTILVLDNNGILYQKSEAIRVIVNQLVLFKWLGFIIWLIPTTLSNKIYDLIARYRYLFFGKYSSCPLLESKRDNKRIKT